MFHITQALSAAGHARKMHERLRSWTPKNSKHQRHNTNRQNTAKRLFYSQLIINNVVPTVKERHLMTCAMTKFRNACNDR